jgi:hypothetical protein
MGVRLSVGGHRFFIRRRGAKRHDEPRGGRSAPPTIGKGEQWPGVRPIRGSRRTGSSCIPYPPDAAAPPRSLRRPDERMPSSRRVWSPHSPAASPPASRRRSASPPRRRAWVRDQSYEEGSRPYRSRHSAIAASTPSRLHRRWIAPA